MQRSPITTVLVLALLGLGSACSTGETAQITPGPGDVITGRVTSDGGTPEAGVWVIAESFDVMANDGRGPDAFRKIVVTNDEGRFLIPDLPDGTYDVWVRGYGLVDSRPFWTVPGEYQVRPGTRDLEISVARAATPQEAAKVYPANYWYSLLELPPPDAFPGEGEVAANMNSQAEWMGQLKLGCNLCHQIGTAATRLGSREAWEVAVMKSPNMYSTAHSFGYESLMTALGDWSERIRNGAVPPAPPRPTGVERNVVITQWEVADMYAHPHDITATDRRDPTQNAYGPIYLVDYAQDWLITLDPVNNSWKKVRVPTHPDDRNPTQGYTAMGDPVPGGHSNFGGMYEHSFTTPHNPMMDEFGRVWLTTRVSSFQPEYCPPEGPVGSFTVYDPRDGTFEVVPTCFGTHHLEFADGEEGRLWTCSLGYLDTNEYRSGDSTSIGQAQGQATFLADSDGDGQGDTQLSKSGYGVYPSPDGSVWNSQIGPFPGRINRWDPATGTFETFQPPYGHGPRGITVDSEGVVWTALAGSGHLAAFDRRKCARTWGTGEQCAEGWSLWKTPGPIFQGFVPESEEDNASAEMLYYIWVDRHNASGFGENTVIVNGTGGDALHLFDPETEQFTTIRVPYPLQYNSRGSDARIDDPDAGWRGRGIWSSYSSTSALLTETKRPSIVHMQIRPDPLAN